MKKIFVCFLIVLYIFNLTAFCEETKIYTFPGEDIVFEYSFQDGENVIKTDFLIKPIGITTLDLNYKSLSSDHVATIKVINKTTNEIIYNSTGNFLYNEKYPDIPDIYEQKRFYPTDLKTDNEYYIELSNPTIKNAKGQITLSGRVDMLTELAKLRNIGIANDVGEGPYQPVKRGEMAKIISQTLKISYPGVSDFVDVADNVNSGYIGLAQQMKIVDGYGDGLFMPEKEITYYEAVKMIVCMLGYRPVAEEEGYPYGYLKKANELGLILYPNAQDRIINLDDIGKILYKAIDTPLMLQTGFGTESQYEIADGVNNKLMTIRNTYLATE